MDLNVCKSIRCVIITDIDAGKYKCVYETRSRIVLMIRILKKSLGNQKSIYES